MKLDRMLALAWRESRFARRRLLLFLSAISLGVAALVAVQGFAANMERGVREQSRELLGADLALSSSQAFGERAEALLDSLAAAEVPVRRTTALNSMALLPRTGATRLVQLRAPEPGFPFYGEIETEPAGAYAGLHGGRNALVDPALLISLGARVGDSLRLGEQRFRILGTLQRVPGDAEIASAFAPRVFIPASALDATGLVEFGSRVDYQAFAQLPAAQAARIEEAYQPALRPERVRLRTAEEQQEGLQDALDDLWGYLGLVGVFALLLGGIGVASAMRAYMARKQDTVAVLRCLGATSGQVLTVYLLQAALMGLLGALLGAAIGAAVQGVLPALMQGLLPVQVEVRLDGASLLTGVGVGVWTAAVFALLPLLGVRQVPPLAALRRRVQPVRAPRRDAARWAAWTLLALSVLALFWLQVEELDETLGLAAGIAGALAALAGVAWLLARALGALPRGRLGFALRQGLGNLHRPGNQTRVVVLALGFGVFLLATLFLTQHNLLAPLRTDGAATRANLLFWDVQQDQAPGLVELLRESELPVLQQVPIVPMRVAAINGEEVRPFEEPADTLPPADGALEEGEAEQRRGPDRWAVRREYRSTFRDTLVASERLLEGEWFDALPAGAAAVSLERDIADDLAVGLGDTITWNVQGVRIPTVVASIREVDWARFEPNFFAVFPPELLTGAPQTWVVLTRADSAAARAGVQQAAVARFPNLSAIDLTIVQQALDQVIDRVTAVIRFLAAFSIATGFVVLLGAVATSQLERMRESVLLKTLGATRRQIGRILLAEYLLLGLVAALAGVSLAVGAGWALARWRFDVPFQIAVLPLAALGAGVVLLSALIGLWASRAVFRETPLEALREE